MTAQLSVNLNKVALLRNQRSTGYPSVVAAASIVLDAGADGITVHPRPDGRHIRAKDVYELGAFLVRDDRGRRVELNVEGYPSDEFLELVDEVGPDQVTLVPDAPDALTSTHGWDISENAALLSRVIERLRRRGIRPVLFIDPDPAAPALAARAGAERVEIFTGAYAASFFTGDLARTWQAYADTVGATSAAKLGLNAGHDLNLQNLGYFLRHAPGCLEVSIGHALTCDALMIGWRQAVGAYRSVIHTSGTQAEQPMPSNVAPREVLAAAPGGSGGC